MAKQQKRAFKVWVPPNTLWALRRGLVLLTHVSPVKRLIGEGAVPATLILTPPKPRKRKSSVRPISKVTA